jgi:hypothetical protein
MVCRSAALFMYVCMHFLQGVPEITTENWRASTMAQNSENSYI